jgi:hypothetical protein
MDKGGDGSSVGDFVRGLASRMTPNFRRPLSNCSGVTILDCLGLLAAKKQP